MKPAVILGGTLVVGIGIGVAGSVLGPVAVSRALPNVFGRPPLIEGQILKKQREANRLLLKVQTDQGPVLATFTSKVAEIDLLVEPGDVVLLGLPPNQTFVDDPPLERVKRPPPAPARPQP